MLRPWVASLVSWQWRRGMFWCLFKWERDVSCLCFAFSAVLTAFLPCEACRENVSHGVIMTNPPPHTQPPFLYSTHPPSPSPWQSDHAHFFLCLPTVRKQDFLFSLHHWTATAQKTLRHVWRVEMLMWLFSLSGDCHVYLRHFLVSVTAVEWLAKSF